jgi:hypothetical protein
MKLVRLIKTYLNETYSKVHTGKHLSDAFPIQNGWKQRDALSPLISNFTLEWNVQENKEGLEMNGAHQIFVYADDVAMS